MLTNRSLRSRFLAYLTAGGMCLAVAGNTHGADCGCAASCDVCPTVVSCGRSCDCSSGCEQPNCLDKAFNAFTGGIGKMLCFRGFGGGCDEPACDDGCDAAMMGELMEPMNPSEFHHHPHHVHSAPPHSAPVVKPYYPPVYSGPTKNVQITPTGPSQWQGAGQPVIDPPESEIQMAQPLMEAQDPGQHLGGGAIAEPESSVVPPPVRMPEPEFQRQPVPDPAPNTERGSLFDSLSDPFRDDQTRSRIYHPVRPSGYDDVELRPISKRPLSRSYSESSRRVSKVR